MILTHIKAEFKKLTTVRSTYILMIITAVVLLGIVSLFANGIRDARPIIENFTILQGAFTVATIGIPLISIAGLLLITHEYQHNTIIYTFTAAKKRMYVVLAKYIVVFGFILTCSFTIALLSYVFTRIGLTLKDVEVIASSGGGDGSTITTASMALRLFIFSLGYASITALFAFVIRNQVGAIAALFLLPGFIEGMLSALLGESAKYLPLNAMSSIADLTGEPISRPVTTVMIYVVLFMAISLFTVQRRDAD